MVNRFEEVRDKINRFLAMYPDAEWGFAHIILSDYNLEDDWIEEVLKKPQDDYPGIRDVTNAFLKELQQIPEDERVPDRGDDEM